jgi:AraC-like DNA-binding protein
LKKSDLMQFAYHRPPAPLTGLVKTIWTARGTKQEFAAPDAIVPDGCVELIFNLADPFRNGALQPLSLLAGQMTGPVVAVPTGAVDLIGVRFRPGRGGAALRTPMWELQDRLIDASGVLGGMDRLVDDLRNLPRRRRLDYVSAVLANRFGDHVPPDSALDHALAIIESRRGNVAIERLARHLGMTRRHLERRFRNDLGLGAKHIARIARVHAVLHALQRQPRLSGAEIAATCGYSDQPHMIRDCKAIAGHTPARLMTSAPSLAGRLRAES